MSRIRLLFSEAWSSISQNISTTFAATMTVLIGMFLLGLFVALGTWVLSYSDHVKKELQVKVYFAQTTTDKPEYAVNLALLTDKTRVKTVVFVSKEQAQKIMAKKFPALYNTPLPSNPLPDAWVITPTKGEYTEHSARDHAGALCGVDDALGQQDRAPRADHRRGGLDRVPHRGRPPRHSLDAADREHDPALDLRPQA